MNKVVVWLAASGLFYSTYAGTTCYFKQPNNEKHPPCEATPTSPVPHRDAAAKQTARACVASHGRLGARAYFVHNRKAGGTTVRKWLGDQQICHDRFTSFVEESMVFNVSRLAEPGTVFLTAVRDPVGRILSSYKFEGEGTFAQWMKKVQLERTGGKRGRVWMEVQNYYIQRFSGYRWKGLGPDWSRGESSAQDPSAPNWAQLYDRAIEVLHQFDLAFVVETMHDADAMANGAAMIGVEVFNHTTEAKSLGHERIARYTRGPAPKLNLSTAELALLQEWNSWDSKFFEAVKAKANADAIAAKSLNFNFKRGAGTVDIGSAPSSTNTSATFPPLLSACAQNMDVRWGEPIERLRRKVNCGGGKRKGTFSPAGHARERQRQQRRRMRHLR